MPALPTLTVTDAQANRLLSAFGSVAAYKQWLTDELIEYVVAFEERQEYEAWATARRAKNDQMRTELTP